MKKTYFTILFIFIIVTYCYCQSSIIGFNKELLHKSGGTYIMGVICKNGIIVASDSRESFTNSVDKNYVYKIIAYFEGSQKIFQYNNILIAVGGYYSFEDDDIRINGLFNKFQVSNMASLDVNRFYDAFIKFSQSLLSPKDYNMLLKNQFLICGYLNNKPAIFYYFKGEVDSLISSGCKTNVTNDDSVLKWAKEFRILSIDQSIPLVKKIVKGVIKKWNNNTVSVIGGSPSIFSISSNKITRDSVNSKYNYNNESELADAILKRKIHLWYKSKSDSIELDNSLKYYLKKRYYFK